MSPTLDLRQVHRLQAVLEKLGWRALGSGNGLLQIWRDPNEKMDIVVPLNPAKADFQRLLAQAIRSVESYGPVARDPWLLSESVLAARLETTSWKRETSLEPGLIPWTDGEEIFAAARSSLIAAAKSTREHRAFHGQSGSFIAHQFLDRCVMGQTGAGSFIVRAHTPSDEMFHLSKKSSAAAAGSNPRSVARVSGAQIIETLGQGLKAVGAGLDEYRSKPRVEVFRDLTDDGVSYELLRSLADLTREGDSSVEIVREVGDSKERTFRAEFTATDSPILERASRDLLTDVDPVRVTVAGEVTNLTSDSAHPQRVVRLKLWGHSPVKNVRVRLNRDQYDVAIEAHKTGQNIELTGTLEKEKRLYWIYGAVIHGLRPRADTLGFEDVPLFDLQ